MVGGCVDGLVPTPDEVIEMKSFTRRQHRLARAATLFAAGCAVALAAPATWAASGKLLLTGGVSSIDGAAGGGLTPWAVIGSYASGAQIGGTAFITGVQTQDYRLGEAGVAIGIRDRVEVSLARQNFDTRDNLAPLGLAGLRLKQDIYGLKVRVAGDAVLDSDTLMPQIAVGLQHRRTDAGALGPTLFGAARRTRQWHRCVCERHQVVPRAGRAGQRHLARHHGQPERPAGFWRGAV